MFPDAALLQDSGKGLGYFFKKEKNIYSNCHFLKQNNKPSKIVNVTRTIINNGTSAHLKKHNQSHFTLHN